MNEIDFGFVEDASGDSGEVPLSGMARCWDIVDHPENYRPEYLHQALSFLVDNAREAAAWVGEERWQAFRDKLEGSRKSERP